jgi:DNA-binding NtrC family response regulator
MGLSTEGLGRAPDAPGDALAATELVVLVGEAGEDGIAATRRAYPGARVIVGGTEPGQGVAIRAFRRGADDFVDLEAGDAELAARVAYHLRCSAPMPIENTCGLVGESAEIEAVRRFIRRVAGTDLTALIMGETGTGKECAALLLHRLSRRAAGPLVALNCAAIPEDLLESELFGFERGAFSGAVGDYPGKLKIADGGTLFLDEIGELSPAGQAKILRAIETREAYRIGGRRPVHFDIRVVAATSRDLAAEARAGRFREDLYYRLAVAQFRMPPLRDRPRDLPALARHLLRNVVGQASREPAVLSPAAEACLAEHRWPGNARELRNVLELASLAAGGRVIRPGDLPQELQGRPRAPDLPTCEQRTQSERDALLALLDRVGGNKAKAARALNCSRMTLYRRLARQGVTTGGDRPGVTP